MKQEERTLYDKLSNVAMVIIPFPPAIATGWSMYEWLQLKGVILPLCIAAGVTAGPAMELFLAVTGHIMLTLNKQKDKTWIWGLLVMIIYPIIGLSYYGFNIVGVMFLVAVMFYLMLALFERARGNAAEAHQSQLTAQQETERDAQQQAEKEAWQREQQALELAHRRELAKLERQAQLTPPPSSIPASPPLLKKREPKTQSLPSVAEYKRWGEIPEDVRGMLGRLDKQQFTELFTHLPSSTRYRWWDNLEAYRES